MCWSIVESIVASKNQPDWEKSIQDFVKNPLQEIPENTLEIAAEHNVSLFLAGILKESTI